MIAAGIRETTAPSGVPRMLHEKPSRRGRGRAAGPDRYRRRAAEFPGVYG